MLDLQHRLIRQAINIAVSKAMEDMKGNTGRSIRNLIDLGLLFSTGENQKWFFGAAKKVISNRKNPYHALVTRMLSDVDHDTIKSVGLNLGYSSLIYGAGKLKKRRHCFGFPIPGLLIFDICGSGADFVLKMQRLIREGRELGIYSYMACPREQDDIPALCEIAEGFEECLFILKGSPGLISERTAGALGRIQNLMISVEAPDRDFSLGGDQGAFRLLKENRCLYGFHVSYNEETAKRVAAPEYIDAAIGLGNLFGVYIAENGVSEACRDAVYAFASHGRGGTGRPLVTMEWDRDIQNIAEKIFSGDGCGAASLAEWACCESIRAKDALTESFLDMLRGMRPCTGM